MEEQTSLQNTEAVAIILSPDWKSVKEFDDLKYIVSLWNLQINTTMDVFNQMGEEKKYFKMSIAPAKTEAPLVSSN